MGEQLGFLEGGAYNTLNVTLHTKRTDPLTSAAAVPSPAKLAQQAIDVLEIIPRYGQATPWELAHEAWDHDLRLGKTNVTEVYYAIQRRPHDLVVAERVRIVGERECGMRPGGKRYHVVGVVR